MTDSAGVRVTVPTRLLATAGALTALVVVEVAARVAGLGAAPTFVFPGEFVVGVATVLPFIAGIAYAGRWLAGGEVDRARHRRVWWWTVTGAGGSLLLNAAIMAVMPVASTLLAVGWLRWAVTVGAGVGVLVGVTEARAIQHATDAERAAVRARHLERQRDLLDYLNNLLRHEVLNASNVISGYADLLREEHDPGTDAHEYADTVHRRSEEITSVIRDVRVLLHATDETAPLDAVDVGAVLDDELDSLRAAEDVEVDASVPDDATAWADALLDRVFENLLRNAVEHHDGDTPHVDVDARRNGDRVVVEVADDGPGVPDDEVGSLFERPSRRTADHRLGLYLVDRLVARYDGSVELADTGPSGSTFRVTLPAADAGDDPPMATSTSFAPPRQDDLT